MSERTWFFSRLDRIIVVRVNRARIALEFPILPATRPTPFSLESHLGTMSFGGGIVFVLPLSGWHYLPNAKSLPFL